MFFHQVKNSIENYTYNAKTYTNSELPPHFHNNYELIYVFDGCLTVELNNNCTSLEAGDLLMIGSHTIHSFKVNSETKIWVGVFSPDYVPNFNKTHKNDRFDKFKCKKEIEDFLIENLFKTTIPDIYILTACLNLVCSECEKNAKIIRLQKYSDFLENVLEYISSNFKADINLQELADKMGYEYHYCSSVFHTYFNMNFCEFINIYRTQYALQLLAENKKNITTIAFECGFQSLRNFNRVFKRITGMTPNEYKKSQKSVTSHYNSIYKASK